MFFLSLRPQQPALLSKSSILDTASSCCVQITPQGRETELRFGGSSATQDAKRRNTFSLWHRAVLTLMFINPNRSDVGCACAQGVTSCWQAGQNLIPSTARSLSPPWVSGVAVAPKRVSRWIAISLEENRWEKILFRRYSL